MALLTFMQLGYIFVSILRSEGRGHVGSLFTTEDQKEVGW